MATAELSRETWLAMRRNSIGSSEAAAILGEGYDGQTRMTVWENKVYGIEPKFSDEQEKRLKVGKMLEPGILRLFTEETGIELDHADHFVVHPTKSHISATLDAGFEEDGVIIPVEAKLVAYFAGFDWRKGDMPLKFQVQTHHQMLVTGAPYAYLFGIVDGMPEVRKIERDPDFIEVLELQIDMFWRLVKSKTMPEPDGKNGTAQALTRIFSKCNGETVELPEEAYEWDARLVAAKNKKKDAEEEIELFSNKIRAAIGEAEFGKLPDGSYYRWQKQTVEYKAKEAFTTTKRVLTRSK
jgi:predicted phage-related endonuclease